MQDENHSAAAAAILIKKPFSRMQKISVLVVALILLIIVVFGIYSRNVSMSVLATNTDHAADPIVNIVKVSSGKDRTELVLPGNAEAFNDAPIYARTSGYLKHWYVDIGANVRQGQLLAEIETPEVDQQLEQARADVRSAQENEQLAQTIATRYQKLIKDNSVSKQETDQRISDLSAKKSILDSATANVHRLEELQSFEKILAPFEGAITARNTDIGSLIGAGPGNTPKELFHIVAISRLRVFVSVPEVNASTARDGSKVSLTLDEYPGKVFTGVVTRNTHSIDQATRTLRVEIDIDNSQHLIKPGSYVLAHFQVAKTSSSQTLVLPANAVLFRADGLRAAVVRDGKAVLVPISMGRDFGSSLEITSGLSEGEQVIVNPSDSLVSGTPVKLASANGTAK